MKKRMQKRTKQIIYCIIGILLIVLAFGVRYLITFNDYQKDVAAIEIRDIDLNTVSDGVYVGECDVSFIYAKVQVTVYNHKITEVKLLEYKHDRGAVAVAITDKIIAEQKISVDTISGATSSSKVIQEAVQRALS